ncbi:MAG TPA: histidine kinase dimerization/phospho-acceptor domain-containing protein [Verrucomicrobiae bacterium]|nr:histidine kinase dimerization/phospho-acceptor domain-containing protein [Verrucomicrobiae bacterium]
MREKRPQVLIAIPEGKIRRSVMGTIGASESLDISLASSFRELESRACCSTLDVIVMSEEILGEAVPLREAVRRIAAFAPVVVLSPAESQQDLAGLVISGAVDVVTLSADYSALAAAFVGRRLNSTPSHSREFCSAWNADLPSDFAEILRHEINNPLTGILGNAELLLSQLREKLPPSSVQRLETVVDLAVRLREKVRCLAAEPATRESGVHSITR